jgi:LacI family transcriptional regulator
MNFRQNALCYAAHGKKGRMNRQVAVVFHKKWGVPYILREMATAISEYARAHARWQFHLFPSIMPNTLDVISDFKVDGVIAIGLVENDAYLMEGLALRGIPAVHAGELHADRQFHEVCSPNLDIGRVAAEHLLECGLHRFAFVGVNARHVRMRCEGFVQRLASAGHREVATFFDDHPTDQRVGEFLAKLRLPVGVMAGVDALGWIVSQSAFRLGIGIPDQVALVGMGDEEPWSILSTPELSSIVVQSRKMGLEAAAMLDKLMSGQPAPLRIDVLSPRVIERESTAIVLADAPEIAAAIRHMRQHFSSGILAKDVAEFAGVSRSTLERGVKLALGRTPLQEILRLRFTAVKELLAETDLPMKAIATRCGFPTSQRLSTAFRSAFSMTPQEYRRQQRGYPSSPGAQIADGASVHRMPGRPRLGSA